MKYPVGLAAVRSGPETTQYTGKPLKAYSICMMKNADLIAKTLILRWRCRCILPSAVVVIAMTVGAAGLLRNCPLRTGEPPRAW
jgi:hypothetical protein